MMCKDAKPYIAKKSAKKVKKAKKRSAKRWQALCSGEWRIAVLREWNHRCAVCGTDENIQAHHIIHRRSSGVGLYYRWNVDNGMALCAKHHEFSQHCSAHGCPAGFLEWLVREEPQIHQVMLERKLEQHLRVHPDYPALYEQLCEYNATCEKVGL